MLTVAGSHGTCLSLSDLPPVLPSPSPSLSPLPTLSPGPSLTLPTVCYLQQYVCECILFVYVAVRCCMLLCFEDRSFTLLLKPGWVPSYGSNAGTGYLAVLGFTDTAVSKCKFTIKRFERFYNAKNLSNVIRNVIIYCALLCLTHSSSKRGDVLTDSCQIYILYVAVC